MIDAFIELSKTDNTQIVLTTHSPSIVKLLEFEHLKLIKENDGIEIVNVEQADLPYPSLNEVNFLAFDESDEEYHNELYGYIESEQLLKGFKTDKETRTYIRLKDNGDTLREQKILSEYIRHQIHHPENTQNTRFTNEQLQQSIDKMRIFIKDNFQ